VGVMRTQIVGRLVAVIAAGILIPAVLPAPASAAEVPSVMALQSPAWVQRDGYNQALRSDFVLRQDDVIRTGATGKVYLRMPDWSVVKLGSDAELRIEGLSVSEDAQGDIFDGVLRVLKGAFRFTTQAVGRATTRRNVRVHIGTATAGIRGTDIWGSSNSERDLICLLEGEIAVRAEGYSPQVMDQPLQFFVVPTGQAPLPVSFVPVERVVNEWAPQTDLTPGVPTMTDGPWAVVLASYMNEATSVELTQSMGMIGYPARIAEVEVDGLTYYRVVVAGFADREQAQSYIDQTASMFGVFDAWLWQSRSPH
jgi:FecR protein/SPOR domain